MKFGRKILPNNYSPIRFSTKKKLHEDEINFELLRSYRLERVKKELEKRDIGACILFDPVNVRYALDSTNHELSESISFKCLENCSQLKNSNKITDPLTGIKQ